jgi:Phage P22-like portal protein
MTPEDFDKDALTDEDIWRECAERLRIATAAESENRIKGIDALKFRWGDQWDADIRNNRKTEGRPALTINHTNTIVSRLENTLRQQRPRIKCHPVGDGADIDTAGVVNGLIRHIETISNASVAYDTGVISALNIGWGYWRIVSKYLWEMGDDKADINDQELLIRSVCNSFTVYMDPAATSPDGRDMGWCIISETMKRAEYKRKYPNAENVEWRYVDAPGDMTLDWESKEEVRLAEYYRIHEVRDTLCKMNDGSVKLKSQLPGKGMREAIDYNIAIGQDGKPITRVTSRRVVEWFRLNGRTIVDRRIDPGQYIPVVRCEGNVLHINGRVLRKGMVEDLKDPAQMFNYTETQKTERYALTPKAPWVAAEGQLEGHTEWDDANQKSYSVLVYKPIAGPDGVTMLPPPQRTPPAQAEAGMAEWSQSAERNLMAVAGMPQENPEISARVMSGNKYLQRRQGMQDLTHFQYYDNQTLAMAWTGELLLERIPFYYDMPRMQRIVGVDGMPEIVPINQPQPAEEEGGIVKVKNDMTVGRYNVVMDTGPGYATKREEGAEHMMELLGTPLGEQVASTSGDIIVRNMDFHGADEVADRLAVKNPEGMEKIVKGLPKQAQNIIGSLMQQNEQKDQQLQQMAQELKFKTGIETMKDEGQTKRAMIQATTKAHDTETRSQVDMANATMDFQGWLREIAEWHEQALIASATKKDVAEIQQAGSLLNTRVEAEANDRAADKAIKAGAQERKTNGSGT